MSHREVSILLVEDDPLDVMAMQRGMKKHRILNPLIVAENGAIALDILRGAAQDRELPTQYIVLLDINAGHEWH